MAKQPHRISDAIRDAVKDSDLSNYRMAREIGVSQPLMSRFASGHVGMSLDKLDRLAELLDLSIVVGPHGAKPSDFVDRRFKRQSKRKG